jgi:hypothetical protein
MADPALPSETNKYSAASSALGYLAQVEYALLLVLRRMTNEESFEVSVETLDDIVFHLDGNATELLQTKHRVDRTATVTDRSADVWKPLHNWTVTAPVPASLTLITNAVAPEDSALALLRPGPLRNVLRAMGILETVARTSEAQTMAPYFQAFLNLEDRAGFLENVFVVDGASAVADLGPDLERAVRMAVRPQHRTALVERLRGWWHSKVHDHLTRIAKGEHDRILSEEVEYQLGAIAQQFRDDDLPIDFYDMASPSDDEVIESERPFVLQLRLIALSNPRIRQCIYDHNRAFAQRSRWEREKLLHVGELKNYEARLIDEWRRHFLPETDDEPDDLEEAAICAKARGRFLRLDQSVLPKIRPQVVAEYVANGSLHMLADTLAIGWHPQWLERLREILPEVAPETEGAA